jgi:serine protein kinase
MEEVIEQVVSYFRHAAQGLEEKKQILYLLGPVGGGKSSLAERLKSLIEKVPFYAIKGSPVHESPLGCSTPTRTAHPGGGLRHPRRYLNTIMSPWAVKRLHEFGGDISRFRVVKLRPSVLRRSPCQDRAGRREQPGHLVAGRQGRHPQARALFAGRPRRLQLLGRPVPGQPGLLEFVEMFKAPIKVLHPLLTATQEATTRAPRALARSPSTASCWRTRTSPNGRPSRTTATTRPFSTASTSSRCRTACACPTMKIYEKLLANSSLARRPARPTR